MSRLCDTPDVRLLRDVYVPRPSSLVGVWCLVPELKDEKRVEIVVSKFSEKLSRLQKDQVNSLVKVPIHYGKLTITPRLNTSEGESQAASEEKF